MSLWAKGFLEKMGCEVKIQIPVSAVDSQFMIKRHSFNLAKVYLVLWICLVNCLSNMVMITEN